MGVVARKEEKKGEKEKNPRQTIIKFEFEERRTREGPRQ
jgi:hypothetical protein